VKPKFKFIDLFAGIGGFRLGFESIGGECVWTSEWNKYSRQTYAANFLDGKATSHPFAGDITAVTDTSVIPPYDLLLAGFPCQPFSIAGVSKRNALGRKHGFECETQGTLFFDLERIIDKTRPATFVLENVRNLKNHDKGITYDVIMRTLRDKLHYHVPDPRILDAQCWVPQHRERIFIIGFREPVDFDLATMTLPPEESRPTLAKILHRTDGTEPVLDHDRDKHGRDRFFDHKAQRVQPEFTRTPALWKYLQDYAAKHRAAGNGFGFGRVTPDMVSRTISARYHKDGSEILLDQGKRRPPRMLTPRECARLMGFPDSFLIPVSNTQAWRQFGNAVVVDVVKAVAEHMQKPLLSLVRKDRAAAKLAA
jgi:DNA (cytosine-5)-methyltransferase 1